MNNINKIFSLVQKHCLEHTQMQGQKGLQQIASQVGISVERLHFYLECLQETGLLSYAKETKIIVLTDKGTKASYVFPTKNDTTLLIE